MFKILTLIILSIYASEVKFLPYMAEHENLGCPSNSKCSKKIGIIRHQLLGIAKSGDKDKIKKMRSFISSYGILLPVWGREKAQKNNDLILWDSSCKAHNKEKLESMKLVEVFSKNLNSLDKEKDLFIPRAIMADRKSKRVRSVIRGDAPILIDGDDLIYIQEIEGFYFGLRLDIKGNIRIEDAPKVSNYPSEVRCSDEVTKELLSLSPVKHLYQGAYCKIVWNKKSKKYETLALGWSCD